MHSNQTAIAHPVVVAGTQGSCSTMVLSENTTRDGAQMSHLMELPMELHICIRNQLLTDPDLTFKGLQPLRLVCKTFNVIWSPVLVTNMVLFRTDATDDALAQLRHIVHGKSNESALAAYTTLTIQHLCCVDTELDRWFSDVRRACEQGIIEVLIRVASMLIMGLIVFITLVVYLILSALTVYPIFSGLYIAILPVEATSHLKRAILKFQARYYMALLPRNLNMGNIRHVRLWLNHKNSDWAIYRSTRILLSLPHLTELELGLTDTTDLEYLFRCLEPLKGLHKLKLLPVTINPTYLRCMAALISNNDNLTHFDWRPDISPDFSALLRDVPTTKPLKLQHLSLSRGCANFDSLVPHIRSLTSVEFRSKETNLWCISFSQAKVFPPTIKVELLDQELATFISNHPGLLSLTICSGSIIQGTGERDSSSLCKALTRHTATLQHLFFSSKILAFMLQNVENKANFIKSTGNLRELVLETEETFLQYQNTSSRIYSERRILSDIAHANHSLTVIIRTGDKTIFYLCIAFCRASQSPLIRDLAGRVMYERVQG